MKVENNPRYIGTKKGKQYWEAIICGHPVTHNKVKRCWKCWKPEMGKSQIGKSKPAYAVGVDHHSWKGGRHKHKLSGYVTVHAPDHPNAQSSGYILEHRLIMEKHVGRYLKRSEVIHHINHDTTDNRIENLMLFRNHSEHLKYEYRSGRRRPSKS